MSDPDLPGAGDPLRSDPVSAMLRTQLGELRGLLEEIETGARAFVDLLPPLRAMQGSARKLEPGLANLLLIRLFNAEAQTRRSNAHETRHWLDLAGEHIP